MVGERRGEEGMPLLEWLLFTRISGAYVNPPSAVHLSTQHARACACSQEAGIMSESECQMYLSPTFSVCPSVCPSVCLPACLLALCPLIIFMCKGIM